MIYVASYTFSIPNKKTVEPGGSVLYYERLQL